MKYKKLVLSLALASCVMANVAYASSAQFTAEQQEEIGKIASDYLIQHPDFLLKVSQKLQEQQYVAQQKRLSEQAVAVHDQIVNNDTIPAIGPKTADVVVVEFFDYQCVYCSHAAKPFEKVIEANKDVRFIFNEFPIFGSRWETSQYAAEMGYAIYNQYGSESYVKYHNGVYATGKMEGNLTHADVDGVIKSLNLDLVKLQAQKEKTDSGIEKLMDIGSKIGLQGTPAFIIMPAKNATIDNVKVIPGFVDQATLQSAIQDVRTAIKTK